MNTIINIPLKIKDDRTGISYHLTVYDEKHLDIAMKKIKEKMDYDYFKLLPLEDRIKMKKISSDFTCPFCLENTDVISRKEKITSGFLLFFSSYLVDIFKCAKCNKEFSGKELQDKKDMIIRNNIIMENFENWKYAKEKGLNPPEFNTFDKIDEFIISFENKCNN